MKNIKPFGPSIGKTKISKKFLNILNKEIDNKVFSIVIDPPINANGIEPIK